MIPAVAKSAIIVDISHRVGLQVQVSPPFTFTNQAYLLNEEGQVFSIGGAPVFMNRPLFPEQNRARAIVVSPRGEGYVVLESNGALHGFGDARSLSLGARWDDDQDRARDLVLSQTGQGGYILESNGDVHVFGDATDLNGALWPDDDDQARAVAVSPSGLGYYILARDGDVYAFGDAVDRNAGLWSDGLIDAVDIDVTFDNGGYWILANDGSVIPVGNASLGNNGFHSPSAGPKARDMTVSYTGKGYYIVDEDAQVFHFGDAAIAEGLPSINVSSQGLPDVDPSVRGNQQLPLHSWAKTSIRAMNDDRDHFVDFEIRYDMDALVKRVGEAGLDLGGVASRDAIHKITYFWVALFSEDQGVFVQGLEGTGNQFIGGYYFGIPARLDGDAVKGRLRVPGRHGPGQYTLRVKTRLGIGDGSYYSAFQVTGGSSFLVGGVSFPLYTDLTLIRKDAAMLRADNLPQRMLEGETCSVTITMQNSGTSCWSAARGYVLAGLMNEDNVSLGAKDMVLPGHDKSFVFDITAPNVTEPTLFKARWQMEREKVSAFGEPVIRDIEVLPQAAYPDLLVLDKDIQMIPKQAAINGTALIHAQIYNQGNAIAQNITVDFFDEGPNAQRVLIGSSSVEALNPGDSISVEQSWIYPGGRHRITVFVDALDANVESVELNNTAAIQYPFLDVIRRRRSWHRKWQQEYTQDKKQNTLYK